MSRIHFQHAYHPREENGVAKMRCGRATLTSFAVAVVAAAAAAIAAVAAVQSARLGVAVAGCGRR